MKVLWNNEVEGQISQFTILDIFLLIIFFLFSGAHTHFSLFFLLPCVTLSPHSRSSLDLSSLILFLHSSTATVHIFLRWVLEFSTMVSLVLMVLFWSCLCVSNNRVSQRRRVETSLVFRWDMAIWKFLRKSGEFTQFLMSFLTNWVDPNPNPTLTRWPDPVTRWPDPNPIGIFSRIFPTLTFMKFS